MTRSEPAAVGRHRLSRLVGVLAVALGAGSAAAEDYASETRVAAEDGERVDAGGPRTVVDLAGEADAASDLAREVEDTPSASVRRAGAVGAPSYLSIRGSDPAHVRVLLDGVPLNGAASTAFDLSSIPLDLVGRLTVYRGNVPLQLGAPLPGGALLVETRFGASDGGILRLGGGSFGTRRAAYAHQVSVGDGDLLVSGVYAGAENDFRYLDSHGTPLNADDDRWATRRNAGVDTGGLLLRHRVRVGRWRLTSVGLGSVDDQGLPGLGADPALATRLTRGRVLAALRAERARWLVDWLDVELLGAGTLEHERYRDPHDELGLGVQDDRQFSWLALAGARPRVILGDRAELRGVADYTAEGTRPEVVSTSARRARRDGLGFGVEAEVRGWDDRLTFEAGGRGDLWVSRVEPLAAEPSHAVRALTWSPRAGLAFEPWTERAWSVRGYATASMAERVPSFFELYGDRGATVGNPDLEPERRVGYDVGLQGSVAGETWSAALTWGFFDRSIDDLIVFVESGLGVSTPVNIGEAAIRGHELALEAAWTGHLRVGGTYTLMDAFDRTPGPTTGMRLPGRPVHSGAGSVVAWWRAAELRYEARGDGTVYVDRAERRPVPPRLEHDITLTVRPSWAWDPAFAISVQNVADERTERVALPDGGATVSVRRAVADFHDQPLPGRAVYATLTLHPAARGRARWHSPDRRERETQ